MKNRIRLASVSAGLVMAFLVSGCAMQYKEKSQAIERQPINCATAEGDIRVLQSEKAHVAQQIAMIAEIQATRRL